jgi:hypothetical protein
MIRSTDPLRDKLDQLAEAIVDGELQDMPDERQSERIIALKVVGAYYASTRRLKPGSPDDADDGPSFAQIKQEIDHVTGGHA